MEKSYKNEIAQRVIRRAGAPGLLKIFEWSDKKNERGTLLLFIEIETADRDNEKIVKTLSAELTKQYFNALTESAEFAFEHALGRANIALKDILLAKPKLWLNKIHVIVLAAVKAEAHLGSVGNVRALLAHRDRIVDILGGGDNNGGPTRPGRNGSALRRGAVNPVKLFSQVTSGRITAEDSLVLLNEAVLDYLSLERIRKTTQENQPSETAAKLAELLSLAPKEKQFGLIAVKRTAKIEVMPVSEPPQYEKGRFPPDSLPAAAGADDDPGQKSSIIEQYLRPSEPRAMEKSRDRLKETAWFVKKIAGKLFRAAGRRGAGALNASLTALNYLLSRILSGLARLPALAVRAASIIKIIIIDPSGRKYYWLQAKNEARAAAENLKNRLLSWPDRALGRWQNLPKKQKIALLGILSLALLLAASLTLRGRALARQKYQADYQKLLTMVKDKSDQAEAALIYKDFALARQTGVEVVNLITALPQKTQEEKSRAQELKNRASALIDKLEKRKNLAALVPLVTILPPPNGRQSTLVTVGKNLYYVSPAERKIAEINAAKGLLLPLTVNIAWPTAVALAVDDNHLLLLAADKAIVVNVKDETIAPRTVAVPGGAAALAGYFNNVYALLSGEGKIWRWKEQGGKYGPAQNWLKENYDLTNAVGLAVDGSLYLLSGNGEISVFANGKLSRRIVLTLLEPLGPGPRLYTAAALKNLYVFDPGKQRIIQLDKNGELRIQYQAAELKDGAAFTVDYMEENMLFLSGDKIYRIPLAP